MLLNFIQLVKSCLAIYRLLVVNTPPYKLSGSYHLMKDECIWIQKKSKAVSKLVQLVHIYYFGSQNIPSIVKHRQAYLVCQHIVYTCMQVLTQGVSQTNALFLCTFLQSLYLCFISELVGATVIKNSYFFKDSNAFFIHPVSISFPAHIFCVKLGS